MSITKILLKANGKEDSVLEENIEYWKERFEFIFIILMSILLIYLFNPRYNHQVVIDYEMKLLLYLFGFILIITADWDTFIKESKFFKAFQRIIGKMN
jgi:hypothetical protein